LSVKKTSPTSKRARDIAARWSSPTIRQRDRLQDSLDGIAPTTLSERLRTRAEWRHRAAFLFDKSPAGRVCAGRQGSRPRPDFQRHAQLGTQILALIIGLSAKPASDPPSSVGKPGNQRDQAPEGIRSDPPFCLFVVIGAL
jgi:hypothetical protein